MVTLTERGKSKDPFRAWKIYCLLLAAFLALMYVVVFAAAFRPMVLADFAVTAVSFLGLYGFAFQKGLGWRVLWRVQCFAFPAWGLVFNFGPWSSGAAVVRMETFALLLLFVPQYWALWKYGYRSPDLWGLSPSGA